MRKNHEVSICDQTLWNTLAGYLAHVCSFNCRPIIDAATTADQKKNFVSTAQAVRFILVRYWHKANYYSFIRQWGEKDEVRNLFVNNILPSNWEKEEEAQKFLNILNYVHYQCSKDVSPTNKMTQNRALAQIDRIRAIVYQWLEN